MADEEFGDTTIVQGRGLRRSVKDWILKSELGENWRNIRWWSRQFTPTSVTIIVGLLGIAGTWIINLSHKVDNQNIRIVVLEKSNTDKGDYIALEGRVTTIENRLNFAREYRPEEDIRNALPRPKRKLPDGQHAEK